MDQQGEHAATLRQSLQGIDLRSADGRAGLGTLLREVERIEPGIVQRICAEIELRQLGLPLRSPR